MIKNNINKLSFFNNYKLLNKESIVLDIGANIGEVTNYISKKYNCNIIAIFMHTNQIQRASTI